ncbi:MAG TPA: hypothetical protein VF730_14400 [Terracidiphilus sp.]
MMAHVYESPWVQSQVTRVSQAWEACAALPLPPFRRSEAAEQKQRESIYDHAVDAVEQEARKRPRTQAERAAMQDRLTCVFGRFAATALDLPQDAIDLITNDFVALGAEFARQARRFDPQLGMEEIFQACRNGWTAGGLQSLLGAPVAITPSILGYSLLYPYSDNYLDSKSVSANQKRQFSERFRRRLCGEAPAPYNDLETAIWAAVDLIESQHSRADSPQVYESLLAIHRAQEESLVQENRAGHCSDRELLHISFAKGGTSVLADACLVSGCVSELEAELAFDWGAVLQLGDDLEDVRGDLRRGTSTLFTRAVQARTPLDGLAAQLLNFSEATATRMNQFPYGSTTLKNLLRTSWRSIVISGIANAAEFFSPAFLDQVEASSPFRFGFLRSRNKQLARRNGVYAKLFNAILEAPEMQPGTAHRLRYIPSPIETNCRI